MPKYDVPDTATDDSALDRFVEAQALVYATVLDELRGGAKRTHWMWFIFPQLAGLGRSDMAKLYAIQSAEEAQRYLDHPILGKRYLDSIAALQGLATNDPVAVLGAVDAVKLRSSLTLFEAVRPLPLLAAALDRWFGGERDLATLKLLAQVGSS